MTARRGAALVVAGLLLGAAAAGAGAGAALAHDSLVDTAPAEGATVTELSSVDLTFSAPPIGLDGADVLQVKGPDGRYYETACPTLSDAVVSAAVAPGAAGEYEVLWRVVSSDGHPVSGSFTFTYEPGAGATPAAGSAEPACAAAAPAEEPAAEDAGTADAGLWLGLGVGAAVIVLVAVGAVLLIRRPRPSGS